MTGPYRRQARLPLISLLLLGAAACGGGGGGNDAADTAFQPNRAPMAQFSLSSSDGFAPLDVTFDAGGSSDPEGSLSSFQWDFGDQASASGATVSHTFTDTGQFTVTLTVTDNAGLTDSTSRSVRVRGTTISGTIQIATGSDVDSDVNDRLTTPVSNNGFGEAQAVGNPARLGGFVNIPGTGSATGNFRTSGDVEDFFAVDLEGDERISLSIGNPSADLDLELYTSDPEPKLVDASVSPDPNDPSAPAASEDLEPPAAGRYFVRVIAAAGASNYVLSIDDAPVVTAARRKAKRLSDPFVPGELLMAETRRAPVRRYGIREGYAGRGLRLEALDTWSGGDAVHAAALRLPEVTLPDGATAAPATLARYRTLLAVRHANRYGDAPVAEVNVLRQPLRVPSDTFYNRQWHYRTIGLEQAWDVTTGQGAGASQVVVAVVDTGVLLGHPDLDAKLLRDGNGRVVGYDFIRDPRRANDGDGLDPDPDDPGDDEVGPGEGSFHGTHVAGTVAAESNNGLGVAGVSWGARIMPLRALGVDGGTTFDVMQAVRYAAGLENISGTRPPVIADVVNLSLGSDFYSEAEQQTLNEVRAQGVFVVASAGNDASPVPTYPAAYDGVISVTATTVMDRAAFYSNFGPQIDVAAPGGQVGSDDDNDGRPDGIASTIGTGGSGTIEFGYGLLQGTSMAAPHVSGVIALMKAIHPNLTPGEFDVLLRQGRLTRDAGPAGRDDRYGWGVIDAHKAVLAAQELRESNAGPVISVSVHTLDFQAFTEQLDFAVNNVAGVNAAVVVTEDAPWLTVFQPNPSSDGFGQYRARVDRTGLADGTYSATITVRSDGQELFAVTLTVLMRVTSPDVNADAGQHYVVLVGAATDETLALEVVSAVNGSYEFSLQDVPPGDYRLYAGTDFDDDDIICDGGEACGAFPSLSSPAIIRVGGGQQPSTEALTFASEFRTTATPTARTGGSQQEPGGLSLRKLTEPRE